MARKAKALTAKRIERAKAPGRYRDAEMRGLYLQINPNGAKSWLLRFERSGVERWMGLGSIALFTLKEAREKAREARRLLFDGVDPIDARRAAKAAQALAAAKAMTFRQCAEAYIAANEGAWRSAKHAKQWSSTLATYAYPHIGHLAVGDIDTGLVLKCVEPHWLRATETMSRTRGRIESVLDWATVRGYRTGDNPARWRGFLEHALPSKGKPGANHHAALAYAELPALMTALRARAGVAARALEFLVLTCGRTNEIIGMQGPEVDLDRRMWTVPAGRMKAGKEHRVALSERAIELLRELPTENGSGFVFIGASDGRGLSSQSLTQVLRRLGRTDVSVHGFRSTFRDWAAECTSFPREICEMALAHNVADKTERAYLRGDGLRKRFALAEAWSRYCAMSAATGETVVPLRGRS